MSKVILNIGYTGTGKTTLVKNDILTPLAGKKTFYIYDVNNEYRRFQYLPSQFVDISKFVDMADKATNAVILYEEATICFSHQSRSDKIISQMVRKRHTNNLLIFNFHSLRAVPLYILDFVNYIYLRKTNDNPKLIENKFGEFPQIYNGYLSVIENSEHDKFYTEEIVLND